MRKKPAHVAIEMIASRILVLRGLRVMLDADLAALYGVSTKRLNEQVRRNRVRFPADFMFRVTNQEIVNLRSQCATSSGMSRHGGRRYLPFAFTEHGALMVANVLDSAHAVEVSVYVVRAFVELRGLLATNKALAHRLDQLEARIGKRLAEQDQSIVEIIAAIRNLMSPREPKRRPIGFVTPKEK